MFLEDCDPGTAFRAEPGGTVVAVIPFTTLTPDVWLCNAEDGWFQVRRITIADGEEGDAIVIVAKSDFTVSGKGFPFGEIRLEAGQSLGFTELELHTPLWIPGSVIATDYRTDHRLDYEVGFSFYDEPSDEAAMTPIGVNPYEQDIDFVNFIGCKGGWLQVLFTDGAHKGKTGWLSPYNQCKNPYTTCP